MKTKKLELPLEFLDKLALIVPQDKFNQVINSFYTDRPTTLRVNTLKTSRGNLEAIFQKLGFIFHHVSWYPDAFVMENVGTKELTEIPEYTQGLFYIQSLSSMIPPLILSPSNEDKVLDIAAAPGSKTTQMASIMHNMGNIVANDNSRIRMYKLMSNLNIQGVTNTTTLTSSAERLWKSYPEYFDKVLVDVPCSMEGRFKANNPKTFENWTSKKPKILAETQKFILRSAVSSTKVGGEIVYSTCTLSPEENEMVIDWIMKKESGKLIIEKIELAGLDIEKPLTSWKNRNFDNLISNTIRVLPKPEMEGFYIAKIRKIDSTIPKFMQNNAAN
jgi:tRNA (cytosine49-C5)-methyltransferase